MKKMSLRSKLLIGIVTCILIVDSSGIGFAAPNSEKNEKAPLKTQCKFDGNKKAELESVLKEAVSSNIITQSESDKVLSYITERSKNISKNSCKPDSEKGTKCSPKECGMFEMLVMQGILTQDKADALSEKMRDKR